jgi:hypothetical protein
MIDVVTIPVIVDRAAVRIDRHIETAHNDANGPALADALLPLWSSSFHSIERAALSERHCRSGRMYSRQ